MTLALLDADIIAYRAAAKNQLSVDWGDGLGDEPALNLEGALEAALHIVADWTKKAGCQTPVLIFSGNTNFRKVICPTYKSNRTAEKPLLIKAVIEAMEKRFKHHRIDGLEGDDVLGIMATTDRFAGSVVVSIDKDMATLPVRLFNPDVDRKVRRISGQLADYKWMTQTLTGDRVDGYEGLPGVGPVKAEKILAEAGMNVSEMWTSVVAAFEAKGLSEDDALLQSRLARILRSTDFNETKQEIALWHPVKPACLSLAKVRATSPSTPPVKAVEKPKSPTSSSGASRSRRSSSRASSKR